MGRLWTFLTHAHTLSGPVVMLLYPLYASVIAIDSPSREDVEQWLAYWILYSFLTLIEMLLQSILERIPIWYSLKLLFAVWLVLPSFGVSAFIYERIPIWYPLKLVFAAWLVLPSFGVSDFIYERFLRPRTYAKRSQMVNKMPIELLVVPTINGAGFIYKRFRHVREHIRKSFRGKDHHQPHNKFPKGSGSVSGGKDRK